VDYKLKFTPSNPLIYPGKIEIEFPSSDFILDDTCRVVDGLLPIGADIICRKSSDGGNPN